MPGSTMRDGMVTRSMVRSSNFIRECQTRTYIQRYIDHRQKRRKGEVHTPTCSRNSARGACICVFKLQLLEAMVCLLLVKQRMAPPEVAMPHEEFGAALLSLPHEVLDKIHEAVQQIDIRGLVRARVGDLHVVPTPHGPFRLRKSVRRLRRFDWCACAGVRRKGCQEGEEHGASPFPRRAAQDALRTARAYQVWPKARARGAAVNDNLANDRVYRGRAWVELTGPSRSFKPVDMSDLKVPRIPPWTQFSGEYHT